MCGIVAIVSRNEEHGVDPAWIRKMGDTILHRGPDDEGYFVRPQVALGNRRLSIIDLQGGKQPISSQDKRHTIVFNGEIFNYKLLRKELISKGGHFRTESDTEVVLVGFAKFGPPFLDRLDGMFSFFIHDALENTFYAGRDAFGIKPLYQLEEDNFYYFASEIKALKTVSQKKWELNEASAHSYFDVGYVVGRETMIEGITRVPAGTVVKIDAARNRTEEPFVQRLLPSTLHMRSKNQINIQKTIIEAVGQSLVADVPVGLYLSGGIDSSLIASIVSKEFGQKLLSFSVTFPENKSFNEGPIAQSVADHLGLTHISIPFHSNELLELRALARVMEEPMADPSAAALLKLSGLAQRNVKVVLSGEGGDELFGGYHRYFWDRFVTQFQLAPWSMRKILILLGKCIPSPGFRRRLQKLEETLDLERHHRWMRWFSSFQPDENVFLSSRNQKNENVRKIFQGAFEFSSVLSETAQVQWVDLVTYLRDDLLVKADKMSMANSLEARVPFLQAEVVTAAFSISDRQRVTAQQTKPILRNMLGNYLPAEIVDRKKQGFEIPLDDWFRGPLQPLLERHLSKEKVQANKNLSWPAIQKIKEQHQTKSANRGLALFSLCLFDAWSNEFL